MSSATVKKSMVQEKQSVFGKFLLDSISIGMYNNPLMLYREYIQNSSDSIDKMDYAEGEIEIQLDGVEHSITIKDNGIGIPAKVAKSTLHDIGRSNKKANTDRGFRGIGRLGGLGYCRKIKFSTKVQGEDIVSVSSWDCEKLRNLINNDDSIDDAKMVLDAVVSFDQNVYEGDMDDHFFIVELQEVQSSQNVLLNVPMVRQYISEVAPVPFDNKKFSFAELIEEEFIMNLSDYSTYKIYLNGEQVFKPYSDEVSINKKNGDRITDIEFVDLSHNDETLAFGWLAKISLLGRINDASMVNGVRVRSGNILVGDKDIFSKLFREERFNSYLVGELHIVNNKLVLNSRRDDFEDNSSKEKLHECFARDIGIPFSKMIREASGERSKQKMIVKEETLFTKARKIQKKGHLSKIQKDKIIEELHQIKDKNGNGEKISKLIGHLSQSKHLLDNQKQKIPAKTRLLLSDIFDIIHKKCNNESVANALVEEILKKAKTTYK